MENEEKEEEGQEELEEEQPKKKEKNKKDDFDLVIEEIHKTYGKESISYGNDSARIIPCDVISTRCLALDVALGVGGLPRGRVIEIFGPEGSGKTTLALEVVAEAQSRDEHAAYIDVEHGCSEPYMKAIGVDLPRLAFSQPDNAEQALGIMETLIRSGKVAVVVLDSVAALSSQREIEGDITDQAMGEQARIMSKALRKLSGIINKTNTCVIFINQIREKIGMMMPGASNETTPGGRALKFYASIRIDIRRTSSLQTNDANSKERIGNETRAKIVKNKVATPFKEAQFTIMFGEGISTAGSILDMAIKYKLVDKNGSWISYKDVKIGQGKLDATNYLKVNPNIMVELKDKIMNIVSKPTKESGNVIEEI